MGKLARKFSRKHKSSNTQTLKKNKVEDLLLKAQRYDNEELLDHAIEEYNKILSLDPQNKTVLNSLPELYVRNREYEKAEKILKVAIGLFPVITSCYNNLAIV